MAAAGRDFGRTDPRRRRSRHHSRHPAPECSNIAERSFRDLSPLRRSRFHIPGLILHSRITARNSVNAAARPYAVPVKLKALLSAVAHAIPEFI